MLCPRCRKDFLLPYSTIVWGNQIITIYRCPKCGYEYKVINVWKKPTDYTMWKKAPPNEYIAWTKRTT